MRKKGKSQRAQAAKVAGAKTGSGVRPRPKAMRPMKKGRRASGGRY